MGKKLLTIAALLILFGAYSLYQGGGVSTVMLKSVGGVATVERIEVIVPPTVQTIPADRYVYRVLNVSSPEAEIYNITIAVGGDQSLDFYILDEEAFDRWMKGEPAEVYDSALSIKNLNHTFTLPEEGRYYILIDNTANTRRTFVESLSVTRLVEEPIVPIETIPVALITIGALIIYAHIRRRKAKIKR